MEKYLIILSIIIIIIVFYYLYCNQKDNKQTFINSSATCNNDMSTLINLAKELQSPTGILIPNDLVLRFRHVFSSGDDDWLRLKSFANSTEHANMAVRNLNVDGSFNLLPRGMITLWNKNVAPFGWAFCDGTRGTPDLRGRFILGQGTGPNLTSRSLGEINGYESKILTIDEMPNHSHIIYELTAWWPGATSTRDADEDAITNMTTVNTGSAGGSASFDKMPPFYVLAYIMKL
jgi:microcystin-dependent protein